MASRQEEKQRRREERLAAERAAAAAAARKQRLRVLGAAGAAVVAVIVVVLAVSSGVSGGSADAPSKTQLAALKTAAAAANCTLLDYSAAHYFNGGKNGALYTHVAGTVNYATNPPSYGNHNPTPASDGDYVGQGTPPKEMLVHALEHGRIELQYKPGTTKAVTDQLETLFNERSGSYGPGQLVLLFQNTTKMPYAVAAVAWSHILGCQAFDPKVATAFRDFRAAFTFKGPEKIAPTGE